MDNIKVVYWDDNNNWGDALNKYLYSSDIINSNLETIKKEKDENSIFYRNEL